MSVRVESSSAAAPGWDAYIEKHALATAYHRAAAVEVARRAFGLRTTFTYALDERSNIVGVLPLIEQSSRLFGRFLVSLPFVTYGGILADDQSIATALIQNATGLARHRRADHVELRHVEPLVGADLPERLDKVSMVLALPGSEEELGKRLGSKLRSQIRRSDREQVEVIWGGVERIADFYEVFAPAMHELGTPVYSRRFFEVVLESLGNLAAALVIRARGEVQAAAIVVRHGHSVEVPWAAATPLAKHLSINMRMYWEMLRFAIQSRAQAFDFGRSTKDSGTYRFKAQWGAQPVQLHWHYWLPAGKPLPRLNHSNPKYARAAAMWRRLPLWCANLLGPYIVRNLP